MITILIYLAAKCEQMPFAHCGKLCLESRSVQINDALICNILYGSDDNIYKVDYALSLLTRMLRYSL